MDSGSRLISTYLFARLTSVNHSSGAPPRSKAPDKGPGDRSIYPLPEDSNNKLVKGHQTVFLKTLIAWLVKIGRATNVFKDTGINVRPQRLQIINMKSLKEQNKILVMKSKQI